MTALDVREIPECLLTGKMQEKPFGFDDLGLVALPTAVICARIFVQYTLEHWHAPIPVVADATIIVGELVKLSVQDAKHLSEIRVRLFAYHDYVAVEVWDLAKKPVEVSDDVTEQPQGIDLVDILAERWSSRMHKQVRTTWAEVSVYEHTPSGLAIHPTRPMAKRPHPPVIDGELLRRVRDGLNSL